MIEGELVNFIVEYSDDPSCDHVLNLKNHVVATRTKTPLPTAGF